jgi:hypothetical protein
MGSIAGGVLGVGDPNVWRHGDDMMDRAVCLCGWLSFYFST